MNVAITTGEPAGIGPDICLMTAKLLKQRYPQVRCILLGDKTMLTERANMLVQQLGEVALVAADLTRTCDNPTHIEVQDIPLASPCIPGQLNVNNAKSVLAILDEAIQGALSTTFAAIVTAPIHKQVINDAGIPFSGHTEYFAEKTNTPLPVMLLTCEKMRVALASTHLALADVPKYITKQGLMDVLEILSHDLRHKFGINTPRILVTGLNPHAGEGGVLGREEIDIITPAINAMKAKGHHITGPLPADTLFTPHVLTDADAVLAMYHDQGLPVLKYASFGEGVNVTLGLPIIRTSVDHGTALDLAGKGTANCGSLLTAVDLAIQLALHQQAH